MGIYRGDYESISKVWLKQDVSTRFIDETLQTNGVATVEQDAIIPQVWLDSVIPNKRGCGFNINRARLARLFTDTDKYLLIPIPWNEADARFNQFFVSARNDNRILQVRYIGQIINYEALIWHGRQFPGA